MFLHGIKKHILFGVAVSIMALLMIISVLPMSVFAAEPPPPTAPSTEPPLPQFDNVTDAAENIILYCAQADIVLYQKAETEKFHPYALAKLVSVLVAWEQVGDLHERFRVEDAMLSRRGATYGFKAGDETCCADLMKMMLLRGFDDAATILGRKISGSDEEYVKLMNAKAAELGAADTHFENTTGRDDLGDTTAYDCALIAAEFIKNDTLLEWAGMDSFQTEVSGKKLYNRNYFLSIYYNASGKQYIDSSVSGLIAGGLLDPRMLIASVNVGDYTYIAVVMNAAEDNGCAYAYEIVQKLVKDYKNAVKYVNVFSPEVLNLGVVCELPINMGEGHDAVACAPERSFSFHVRSDSDLKAEFTYEYELTESRLEAPVYAGMKVGELILYRGGSEVARADLLTVADVGRSISDYYRSEANKAVRSHLFMRIAIAAAAIAVVYVLVVAIYRGQKKKKLRARREENQS